MNGNKYKNSKENSWERFLYAVRMESMRDFDHQVDKRAQIKTLYIWGL